MHKQGLSDRDNRFKKLENKVIIWELQKNKYIILNICMQETNTMHCYYAECIVAEFSYFGIQSILAKSVRQEGNEVKLNIF